jgi:hypothetical protein
MMIVKAIEMLTRDEYTEAKAAMQSVMEGRAYLQSLLRPKMDKSKLEEARDYIMSVPCKYDSSKEQEKVCLAVMLYIFAPEWLLFDNKQKSAIGIRSDLGAFQRLFGISRIVLHRRRRAVGDRYRRKGRFADKVDYVYTEVAHHYNFAEK